MQGALGAVHDEVVDQASGAVDRLCADAGRPRQHVADAELGDEAAQICHKRTLARRVANLDEAGPPIAACEAPGAGPGEVGEQIPAPQARDPVCVAGADQQRGGAEQDLAVDRPRQVATEEGKVGVGDGVDAGADQFTPLGPEAEVTASEGDDPRLGGRARRDGQAVRPGTAWPSRRARPPSRGSVLFRGGYLRLRPERRELVRASIYPSPDPDLPFLGGHLTRTVDGEVLLGPSALLVGARDAYRIARLWGRDLLSNLSWPGTWGLQAASGGPASSRFGHAASKGAFVAVCALRSRARRPRRAAGARRHPRTAVDRAGRLVDDFVVHRTERALHVRNAPSPAATSSLALAKLIADEVVRAR